MPGATSNGQYVIRLAKQADALVSPVRQEIVDAVAASGPSTAAQIADSLGRRPDTLYYHFQALLKVGLLLEVGRQRAGRRFCAVYDVPGRPLKLGYRRGLRAETVAGIVRAALRLADRDFSRAIPSPDAVVDGAARNVWGGRVKGWVTHEQLVEINAAIAHLTELLQSAGPRPGAQLQSFTYVLTPSSTSRPARQLSRAANARTPRPRRKINTRTRPPASKGVRT